MVRFYKRKYKKLRFDLAYNFRPCHYFSSQLVDPACTFWIKNQRSNRRILLLYAGSLSPRKNVGRLVDSVMCSVNLSLLICGDGPELFTLSKKVESSHSPDRVFFAGNVPDIKPFLSQCDILVLPSHAEGLPLVVLEAASMGIPCLLSNLAVHRELVSLGFGMIFNRYSFEDLETEAHSLMYDRTPESDARRVALWRSQFSPKIGFARYERLFNMA
jgi:glycosyltransferase involved in cell wall biosynthesis